jgi:hypothetical protein
MLELERQARNAFTFLERDHSMNFVASSPNDLVWFNDQLAVRVTLDPISCELSLDIWRADAAAEREQPFGMHDLIRATDEAGSRSYRDYAVRTPDALGRGLKRLANDLVMYGSPALDGDPHFFSRISFLRGEAIRDMGRSSRREAAEPAFRSAWKQRDWQTIVDLYGQREAELSDVELARLALARRKLAEEPD